MNNDDYINLSDLNYDESNFSPIMVLCPIYKLKDGSIFCIRVLEKSYYMFYKILSFYNYNNFILSYELNSNNINEIHDIYTLNYEFDFIIGKYLLFFTKDLEIIREYQYILEYLTYIRLEIYSSMLS